MALAARLAAVTQSHGVLYKGGNGRTVTVRANGSDIFLTAIVTAYGETDPDVDLVGAGEAITGVIIGEAFPYKVDLSKDSDSTFDDNTYLQMYIPEDKDQLYLTVKSGEDIVKDDWVTEDGGFIKAGTRANAFGRAKQAATGNSATTAIRLVEWGVT